MLVSWSAKAAVGIKTQDLELLCASDQAPAPTPIQAPAAAPKQAASAPVPAPAPVPVAKPAAAGLPPTSELPEGASLQAA